MELHYPSQTRFGSLTGQLFFYEPLVAPNLKCTLENPGGLTIAIYKL
jgi:hypothetical protein